MNYHRVGLPARWRWRRWWRTTCRVTARSGLVVLWLAGIVMPARELVTAPTGQGWLRTAGSAALLAVLWTAGLALGQPWRGDKR